MAFMEFVGCAFTGFGPAFSLFYWTIMHHPIRIIILIASSFFWLCSFFLSSTLWFLFPVKEWILVGVLISVCFQEFFRYVMYKVLRKSETGLRLIADTDFAITTNSHLLSYVSGLGFGIVSGAFSLLNLLAELKGPGTMGIKNGDQYFCLISALFTMCFIFLQTFWSVIFFQGLNTKDHTLIMYVLFSHILVSYSTLLNAYGFDVIIILFVFAITILSAIISYRIAGGQAKRFSILFKIKRNSAAID